MALAPMKDCFAAGYSDGTIRIWQFEYREPKIVFHGHKGAVSCLSFSSSGNFLASGGKDTEIVVWDLTAESGKLRLKGHTDMITGISFLKEDVVLSSSKDSLLKCWSLSSGFCFETAVARSEIFAFAVLDGKYIISGGNEASLKIWEINEENGKISLSGELKRESKERIISMKIDGGKRLLAVHNNDKSIEFFKLLDSEEKIRRLARQKKRNREKNKEEPTQLSIEDNFKAVATIRSHTKISSFDFSPLDSKLIALGLSDNSLELMNLKEDSIEKVHSIDFYGHRSEIRTSAISFNEEMLLTASKELVKIWNIRTGNPIKTFECSSAVCSTFVPGNKQIIIGTKNGTLELFDISSGYLLESIKVHNGTVWSLCVSPDNRTIVTGGADKTIKFFDFELIDDANFSSSVKRLTLVHSRTLEMPDEVLAVKYSPNQNLLAVSCLDLNVRIFYVDTCKFFLSLYGHKLPVYSIDISSDNSMIITGSADKNVKIWGLDFGDCRKSLFAHSDAILSVKFIANTHYFITSSKDKTIKYWDADKFQCVCTIGRHFGDVWSVVISRNGALIISASSDRSIKYWDRSEDQVFIEEEQEKEIEKNMEQNLLEDKDPTVTKESLKASDKLAEAIDFAVGEYENDELKMKSMGASDRNDYLLKTIEKIPFADLENSILLLPFTSILQLLPFIESWVKSSTNISLTCRILCHICRLYLPQIISNEICKKSFEVIREELRSRLDGMKQIIGFNVAALNFLKRDWEANSNADFFGEALEQMTSEKLIKRKVIA